MKFFSILLGLGLAFILINRLGLKPHAAAQAPPTSSMQTESSTQQNMNSSIPQQPLDGGAQPAPQDSASIPENKSNNSHDNIDEELLLGERNPYMPPKYILDLEYIKPEEMVFIDNRMEAIRRWSLSEYLLIGIIWDVHQPKVMIRDKNSTLHVLKKNQRIGNKDGVISQINEGEMVVLERGVPRVIKIASTLPDKVNLAVSPEQPHSSQNPAGDSAANLSQRNNMLQQSQIQQQLQQLRQQNNTNSGPPPTAVEKR